MCSENVFLHHNPDFRSGLGLWSLHGGLHISCLFLPAHSSYDPYSVSSKNYEPHAFYRKHFWWLFTFRAKNEMHELRIERSVNTHGLLRVSVNFFPEEMQHTIRKLYATDRKGPWRSGRIERTEFAFSGSLQCGAKLQNTPPLICISLNKNSIYCYIPRSSKHTDTCIGWARVFCNRSESLNSIFWGSWKNNIPLM